MKPIESTRVTLAVLLAFACAGTGDPARADDGDVGVSTGELSVAPEPKHRPAPKQRPGPVLYRLMLKNGKRYLDNGCGRQVAVRSGFRRGDVCQLWRVIPQNSGWWRLQTANGDYFLDADHCGSKIGLTAGISTWENGACQAWRLLGNSGGWSKLQLRHGGQFLDAADCGETVAMNPGSTYLGGSCQLWALVPE